MKLKIKEAGRLFEIWTYIAVVCIILQAIVLLTKAQMNWHLVVWVVFGIITGVLTGIYKK